MSNGTSQDTPKWLGVTLDKWVNLFQVVGFPTILLSFLLYAAWCYIPPVVNGHIRLLERTGDTLESMDQTLRQSNEALAEVADIQRKSQAFMQSVETAHDIQIKKLDEIDAGVKRIPTGPN